MSRHKFLIHAASAQRLLAVVAGVGALLAYAPPLALGQPVPPNLPGPAGGLVPVTTSQEAEVDGVFLPMQRTSTRKLRLAEELIAKRRYAEAVLLLDAVLASPEDWFFQRGDGDLTYRSLKREAERRIGQLPERGREIYALQFGSTARRLLQKAVSAGDLTGIANVAERYFHTEAGYEATWLMGYSHLDHGRALAAALCFERLVAQGDAARRFEPTLSLLAASSWQRAGREDRAERVVARLRHRDPEAKAELGGELRPLFATHAGAAGWLDEALGRHTRDRPTGHADWTTHRGSAARNAASVGGQPLLTTRWRVRTANYPAVERVVQQMQKAYVAQGIAALPGAHPLAVGNQIIARTAHELVAVDLQTGKRIWEVAPGPVDQFDRLIQASRGTAQSSRALEMGVGLQHRMWDDNAYGTLSSDGQRVFMLEGLGLMTGLYGRQLFVMRMGGRGVGTERGRNRVACLSAFDLRDEGRRIWQVGGVDSVAPQLADAFFLGAPLVYAERLFALVEIKSGIRLVVLDARTGRLEWSQQLVDLERSVLQDPPRRLAGATPSLADGILVCPTSAGVVVAVDTARHSLLWAYKYPQKNDPQSNSMMRIRILQGRASRGAASNDHWIDPSATLSDGRVLLTPVESDQLHCLSLTDGTSLWTAPRDHDLLVACVHRGNVVLVGTDRMHARSLVDGSDVWEQPVALPAKSHPSGRGYYSGDFYYLPLASAEVVKIDLNEGRIVARAKSRDGHIPGNLICHQDQVISQSVDSIEAYYQLEPLKSRIAKALEKNADDAEALARSGEIALNEGHLDVAVAQLQKSFAAEPNPLTQDLLVRSLLASLHADFAANRAAVPQLETLIDQPRERIELLRLMAQGYQNAGETMPALAAYMRLIDLGEIETTLLELSPERSVRTDRWIHTQLAALLESLPAADRARVDTRIEARMRGVVDPQASVAQMRRFVACFGEHPLANRVRLQLAQRRMADGALLESEIYLRQVIGLGDAAAARTATALMAMLLHKAGQADFAAPYKAQLAGSLSDQICLDGKTGQQVSAELGPDKPHGNPPNTRPQWPRGEVRVAASRPAKSNLVRRRTVLPLVSQRGLFFRRTTVSLDQFGAISIVGHNAYGAERFRVPVTPPHTTQRRFVTNPHSCYTTARDHLLLVWTGNEILAIDTLSHTSSSWQSVLWRRALAQQIPGVRRSTNIQPRPSAIRPGMPRYAAQDAMGRPVGVLGPVLAGGAIYLHHDNLICADPISGETLWVRHGIPSGSELFGDDDLLLVVTTDKTGQTLEAIGFSPVDGQLLGRRTIVKRTGSQAKLTSVVAVQGRRVLATTLNVSGRLELAVRDVWEQRTIWSRTFPLSAKTCLAERDSVAVFDPAGHFQLLSLADGQPQIDTQLEPEPNLRSIHILPSSAQWLLVTDVPPKSQKNRVTTPLPGLSNQPLVSGHVYAFSRATGALQWPKPVQLRGRGLWLTQPAEVPVVVFAQMVNKKDSSGRTRSNMAVLCLDRRSGQALYEASDLPRMGNLDLVGQPDQGRVTLTTATRTIKMTFSDAPPAKPATPFQENTPASASNGQPTGLFRLLGALPRALAKAAEEKATQQAAEQAAPEDPFGEPLPPKAAIGKPAAADQADPTQN
jgi:outer membrane protein assembly factor BamB